MALKKVVVAIVVFDKNDAAIRGLTVKRRGALRAKGARRRDIARGSVGVGRGRDFGTRDGVGSIVRSSTFSSCNELVFPMSVRVRSGLGLGSIDSVLP